MKYIKYVLLLILFLSASSVYSQENKLWKWGEHNFVMPKKNPDLKKLPLISVKGNKFVNSKGDTILFRGLAPADPDKLEQEGKWGKDIFVQMKNMGAKLIRIPIHPVPWRMRTPEKYIPLLDSAVAWCTQLELYVMIDWHSIGNLGMELYQNPLYNTTKKETYEFWSTMAAHFRGHNTVAFFEIFNEPTLFNGTLGSMTWSEWAKINEDIISLIRSYDKEKIPLVAGLDWAYDLTPLHIQPIRAEGIAYTAHPYQHKRHKPYEPKWEEDFGFAAGNWPIIATEFGLMPKENKDGDDQYEYGKAIIGYLESKGISWVGWVFDPLWGPNLLQTWDNYKLTNGGEFFKKALNGGL